MEMKGESGIYLIGEKVAEAEKYRLFLCEKQGQPARQCLLQIASAMEHNGPIDRNAYILSELKRIADELETEYAKIKTDPKDTLSYHLGYPELVDSFTSQEQGGRQVNILAFREVEKVGQMVPLINITAKDRLRVDLRTSAWIMGKRLKLFVLTHSEGISNRLTSGKNILIEPDQHYVTVFDWTETQVHSGGIPAQTRRQEISQAAQAIIMVLGGNPNTGFIPNDGEEAHDRYVDYILWLSRGSESNAERAFNRFYELVDSLWKREFYPFTTKPLTGKEEDDYGER